MLWGLEIEFLSQWVTSLFPRAEEVLLGNTLKHGQFRILPMEMDGFVKCLVRTIADDLVLTYLVLEKIWYLGI